MQQRAGRHHFGVEQGVLESWRRKNRQWRSVQSIIGATEKRRDSTGFVAEGVWSRVIRTGSGLDRGRAFYQAHPGLSMVVAAVPISEFDGGRRAVGNGLAHKHATRKNAPLAGGRKWSIEREARQSDQLDAAVMSATAPCTA